MKLEVGPDYIEARITKLMAKLIPLLKRLLTSKCNFKITINASSAGNSFKLEVVEFSEEF